MDDEDILKRRARRRLIGAVTLIIATVLLLPLLLDNEPRPGGEEIELLIPDKDRVGEFAPSMAMPSMPVTAPASSAIVAVSAPDAASQVLAMPASSNPAVASGTTAPQPGFVVQIGAFTNADSARQLQKKLSKQGIKTYTEKVDDKTRVRAGPFSTREAADKVRHKLEAQGLKPVVNPVQ